MVGLAVFGICVILVSILINIVQLQPGIRAVAMLNARTYRTRDRLLYLPRFIMLSPKLIGPLILDIVVVSIGGFIGFGGGVVGGIIGIASSCLISMAIKLSIWINKRAANKAIAEA